MFTVQCTVAFTSQIHNILISSHCSSFFLKYTSGDQLVGIDSQGVVVLEVEDRVMATNSLIGSSVLIST